MWDWRERKLTILPSIFFLLHFSKRIFFRFWVMHFALMLMKRHSTVILDCSKLLNGLCPFFCSQVPGENSIFWRADLSACPNELTDLLERCRCCRTWLAVALKQRHRKRIISREFRGWHYRPKHCKGRVWHPTRRICVSLNTKWKAARTAYWKCTQTREARDMSKKPSTSPMKAMTTGQKITCDIVHALSMSWGSNLTSRLGNTSMQLLQTFCWATQHCQV